MHTYIQKLLATKVTRREFLTYLGVLMLTVSGISSVMKSVTNIDLFRSVEPSHDTKAQKGFGAGAYGV